MSEQESSKNGKEGVRLLTDIPLQLDADVLSERLLRGRQSPVMERQIGELVEEVSRVASPKALYRISYIENRGPEELRIDGVVFKSRVLRKNLDEVERVFPYIVTAGRELEALPVDGDDMFRAFCLDAVKEHVLEQAHQYLESYLEERYQSGKLSHMNPGSLRDWPLSQQSVLFALFDDVFGQIGVRLTERFLMDPVKSVSGIHFPTEIDFQSCMLCTRNSCAKRRAPYDRDLAGKLLKG
jgi:hypothetical protein